MTTLAKSRANIISTARASRSETILLSVLRHKFMLVESAENMMARTMASTADETRTSNKVKAAQRAAMERDVFTASKQGWKN